MAEKISQNSPDDALVGRRVSLVLTKENFAYVQEWRIQFEFTIGQEVSFEVALNALIGFMRAKRDRTQQNERSTSNG